jgi:TPR repeat protein
MASSARAQNFRIWGVTLAPAAGLPVSQSIDATLSADVLASLETMPAFQTISCLYKRSKGNTAWLNSEQGQAAVSVLRVMRADAAGISSIGPKGQEVLQYTVGAVKTSDANIRLADLVGDAGYRHAIANLIAQSICQSAQVTRFLASLAAPPPPPPAAQPETPAQAAARYQRSCDAGNPLDCIHLAEAYGAGTGVTKDENKSSALLMQATGMYQKSCDAGDATACFKAGNMWMKYGDNSDSANPLYRKACDGGNSTACLDLGVAYEFGYSVPKDNDQAAGFYQRACNGGHASGCLKAGFMYELGLESPVSQDYARAITLFTKACGGQKIGNVDQYYGNPDADIAEGCNQLGNVYRYGHGVPIDMAQAAAFYRKACNLGDSGGCDSLKELGQ